MRIQVSQLNANHQNRNVLRDVSVSFLPGLHYLIGANGSGKTTFLHTLARLHPFKGSIRLDETRLDQLDRNAFARKLALVPQQFHLAFRTRVREYVLMGRFPYLNWLGRYSEEDHGKANQALSLLSIDHFADRFVQQLSGGELQKVLLARAICQETPVLLLDEPAQSLDPWQQKWLYDKLEELAEEGKTIICATHDADALYTSNANVLAFRKGQILFQRKGPISAGDLLEVYEP